MGNFVVKNQDPSKADGCAVVEREHWHVPLLFCPDDFWSIALVPFG
jgi:hypothetical protein